MHRDASGQQAIPGVPARNNANAPGSLPGSMDSKIPVRLLIRFAIITNGLTDTGVAGQVSTGRTLLSSSSLKSFEIAMNLRPGGISREKLEPRPLNFAPFCWSYLDTGPGSRHPPCDRRPDSVLTGASFQSLTLASAAATN